MLCSYHQSIKTNNKNHVSKQIIVMMARADLGNVTIAAQLTDDRMFILVFQQLRSTLATCSE